MKKIFFKTEPFQISSESEQQAQIITKIFIFDLLAEKVYFSFQIKPSRHSDDSLTMKNNFLNLISMIATPEFIYSYYIDGKKAEKILKQKIKNLNGYFLNDFCENYELDELIL